MTTKFNRRSFIKGLGAATGLAAGFASSPVAMGQTDKAPTRVLLVALQHGWGKPGGISQEMTGTEFDFKLPKYLSAMEEIKDHVVIIDGARGTLWGNAHDVSYSDIFTAAVPWGEKASQFGAHFPAPQGPSLDWALGNHFKKQVFRVSAGYRSWGQKSHPLCFSDKIQRLDPYITAQGAYDAIIDPLKMGAQKPDPAKKAKRQSLFEFLGKDTDRLLKKVNGTERLKLESYLDAVNAVGERLKQGSGVTVSLDDIPDRPANSPEFGAMVDSYLDMMKLVFQADTHRFGVLGFGQGAGDWTWRDKNGQVQTGNPWGKNFHHEVAHHGDKNPNAEDAKVAFESWVSWYIRKIVDFAKVLRSTPDVDGKSLLDNTMIMLTGEVGTGQHDTRNKVHIIIGGGDRIKGGRWIQAPKIEPRNRQGVFVGGQDKDGNRVEDKRNYGGGFSIWHTGDVLTELGRVAGLPGTKIGLPVNNEAIMPLVLS